MQFISRVLLTFLFLFVGASQAQTVDEIIQKNIEACGGSANWQAVESMKIEINYTSFSISRPFKIIRKRPDLYRFEHFVSSKPVTRTYDGEVAWWINPWFGSMDPLRTPSPDSLTTLREKNFESIFWNYQDHGRNVELLANTDVDGVDCYALKVTLENGDAETWYLDTDSYLAVKMEGDFYDFGAKVNLVMYIDDYREVNGILLPHFLEQEFGTFHRTFELSSIEINTEVDESIFAMPTPPASEPDIY